MDEKPVKERIAVLVALMLITGCTLSATFLISYGLMGIIEDSGIKSTNGFQIYKVIFGLLLLVGSIIGLLISEFLPNRAIALASAIMANFVVLIMIKTQIASSMTTTSTLFWVFGVTVGLMGPILVMFIIDQYISKEQFLNAAFIYMIGCCGLVISLYRLYAKNLYNDTTKLVNASIVYYGIAIAAVVLIIVLRLFVKNRYFIFKPANKNIMSAFKSIPVAEVLRLIVRNGSAALLFIFVSELENSVYDWTQNTYGYNNTVNASVFNSTVVNASDRFQEGYPAIFLIPVFILFGVGSHPTSYLMVACFSILLAAWLWPFLQKCCIPIEDHKQFIVPSNVTNYPNQCETNLPIVNAMYCLIIFGKLMLVTSILIISCRNLETKNIFLGVAVCFCFLYVAYIIAVVLTINFFGDVNTMQFILFIIMLLNIYIHFYVRDVPAARIPSKYDDSEMQEVKVLKTPPAPKPEPKPSKEQPPEPEPPEIESIKPSVTARRSSRTSLAIKVKKGKKKTKK